MEEITADMLLSGVRSFVPGRLRLRLPLLRNASDDVVAMIRDVLAAKEGVLDVEVNPRVGSLLLTWDPAVLTLEATPLAEEAAGMLNMARMMGYFDGMVQAGSVQESSAATEAKTETEHERPAKPACGVDPERLCGAIREGLDRATHTFERTADVPLTQLARVLAPDVKKGARARRVAQNRLMLGLLGASLAVLASGRGTAAHTGFGAGFLALLTVHLLQHRRVL